MGPVNDDAGDPVQLLAEICEERADEFIVVECVAQRFGLGAHARLHGHLLRRVDGGPTQCENFIPHPCRHARHDVGGRRPRLFRELEPWCRRQAADHVQRHQVVAVLCFLLTRMEFVQPRRAEGGFLFAQAVLELTAKIAHFG